MPRNTYAELLKDPRWQRKRLEILNATDFRCENCDSADKTLHVHHKIYRKGALPWEYEAHELQALCEDCHDAEHQVRAALAEAMVHMGSGLLDELLGYAQAIIMREGNLTQTVVRNYEHAFGMFQQIQHADPLLVYGLIDRRDPRTNEITSKALDTFADNPTPIVEP
jgi:hypothetical protein